MNIMKLKSSTAQKISNDPNLNEKMFDTLDFLTILLVIFYHVVLYVTVKNMIDVAVLRSYVVITTQEHLQNLALTVGSDNLLESLLENQANDPDSEP